MLHHHVVLAVLLARIVDRQNVRVLEHPDHMRFIEEHLAGDLRPRRIVVRRGAVDLDRDVAPEIWIVGKVDSAGGAPAHLIDDEVLADLLRAPLPKRRARRSGSIAEPCGGDLTGLKQRQQQRSPDDQCRVNSRQNIIEHNAQPAM